LRSATWPTVTERTTVLIPVGSIEQHGPHLPLDTDSVIASAVAQGAVARLSRTHADAGPFVLAPTLSYGASGEHQAFPGTSSVGSEALRLVVVELVRSMRTWASRVILVNGHGGNAAALASAVALLQSEGHAVSCLNCATEAVDLHAGFTETSLLLHLDPARVRLEAAEPGNTASLASLLPTMISSGVVAVSPNGVLGDPSGANAAEGRRVLLAMVGDVVDGVLAETLVGG